MGELEQTPPDLRCETTKNTFVSPKKFGFSGQCVQYRLSVKIVHIN